MQYDAPSAVVQYRAVPYRNIRGVADIDAVRSIGYPETLESDIIGAFHGHGGLPGRGAGDGGRGGTVACDGEGFVDDDVKPPVFSSACVGAVFAKLIAAP